MLFNVHLGCVELSLKTVAAAAVFDRDGYLISMGFKVFLWEGEFSCMISYELISSLGW